MPTREQNILDLIISSDHQLVNEVQVLDRFDTSDHNTILAELNFSQKIVASAKPDTTTTEQIGIRSGTNYCKSIWKKLDGNTLNSWNKFKRIILDVEQLNVPTKEVSVNGKKHKPIWMTYKVAKLIKRNIAVLLCLGLATDFVVSNSLIALLLPLGSLPDDLGLPRRRLPVRLLVRYR